MTLRMLFRCRSLAPVVVLLGLPSCIRALPARKSHCMKAGIIFRFPCLDRKMIIANFGFRNSSISQKFKEHEKSKILFDKGIDHARLIFEDEGVMDFAETKQRNFQFDIANSEDVRHARTTLDLSGEC